MQVAAHGTDIVIVSIRVALEKCAAGLGINLSPHQMSMLCSDLIDVYSYDSIEDIQQCLKKARQGKYGFGHHKRDMITMSLIREWMAEHLDEKAIEREKIIQGRKYKESEPVTDEKALEYLAKIKLKISESIEKQSKVRPFDNSESAWNEVIQSDPLLRKFFEDRV